MTTTLTEAEAELARLRAQADRHRATLRSTYASLRPLREPFARASVQVEQLRAAEEQRQLVGDELTEAILAAEAVSTAAEQTLNAAMANRARLQMQSGGMYSAGGAMGTFVESGIADGAQRDRALGLLPAAAEAEVEAQLVVDEAHARVGALVGRRDGKLREISDARSAHSLAADAEAARSARQHGLRRFLGRPA